MTRPVLLSLDFTVEDIDQCLTLLVDLAGLEFVGRARHPSFDADVAQVRSGDVVFNLLGPTDTGQGRPFPAPEPALSHLTFLLPETDDVEAIRIRLADAGAAAYSPRPDQLSIDAQVIKSVMGEEIPLIFCAQGSLTLFDQR